MSKETPEESPPSRKKLEFFRFGEATPLFDSGIMNGKISYPPVPFLRQYDLSRLMGGSDARVVFSQPGGGGFSIVHVRFAPDYILARHIHDTDCTYYIVAGEVSFGRTRVLRAGDGFFVAADQPYGYTAGPQGVELLEFRHSSSFTSRVIEDNEAVWREMFRVAETHRESWAAFFAHPDGGDDKADEAVSLAPASPIAPR